MIEIEKLGLNIKELRNERGLSLKELADNIDVSMSMLSQIESGKANPSLNTLRLISKFLDVPMFSLFMEDSKESAMIVRKDERIRITSGSLESEEYQISYDLLSPDMKGDFQLCEMKISAGEHDSGDFNAHNGEEVAVCTEGEIELVLENESHLLKKGDSVRIPNMVKHRWKNPGEEDCAIIFAISPPVF